MTDWKTFGLALSRAINAPEQTTRRQKCAFEKISEPVTISLAFAEFRAKSPSTVIS